MNLGTEDAAVSTLLDAGLWRSIEGPADWAGPVVWGVDLGTTAAQSAVAVFYPQTTIRAARVRFSRSSWLIHQHGPPGRHVAQRGGDQRGRLGGLDAAPDRDLFELGVVHRIRHFRPRRAADLERLAGRRPFGDDEVLFSPATKIAQTAGGIQ